MLDDSGVGQLTKIVHDACGYEFKDKGLLVTAFTHPSIASSKTTSYERLEFMGDAVLELLISEMLYKMYTCDDEGDLTKKRMSLVSGSRLVEIAKSLNLGRVLRMSKGEVSCGGEHNDSNLENVLEALVGAMYVDGGLEAARHFITKYWQPVAKKMQSVPQGDYKSTLQEWSQGHSLPIPAYRVVTKTGSEHDPVFTVEVSLGSAGIEKVVASGKNKKLAEQAAAKLMLKKVTNINVDSY